MVTARTPRGIPCTCPLCGDTTHLDGTVAFDAASCPSCGALLHHSPEDSRALAESLRERLSSRLKLATYELPLSPILLALRDPRALTEQWLEGWAELGVDPHLAVTVVLELERENAPLP